MARKTQMNDITSDKLISQINPKNTRLCEDFLIYLKSLQRSETTISGYKNDLEIFFVWNLLNANNKFFVDITKRDVVSYQNWISNHNNNSPARVRRLKATLSSLSNYIANILDDEFPNFRNIINKIENPPNEPVREKTVITDENIEYLLEALVKKSKFQQACLLSLGMNSGRRKSELLRFKVSYFSDDNIIYGSLYKTPEKIKTKGRNKGKYLNCYTLSAKFKPYLDLWVEERKRLNIESDWLFVKYNKTTEKWEQMQIGTVNSWAETFSKILNIDFYFHCLRHYFCTSLAKSGLPDGIIQDLIGWTSSDMVKLYTSISKDESIGRYFDENGIKQTRKTELQDL